jgi:hypothetical protein
MCYDIPRKSIVLFGGLSGFGTGAEDLQGKLLGDTWEHIDTSTPAEPPGTGTPGPGPTPNSISILSLEVNPASVQISQVQTVVATVTLSGAVTDAALSIPLFFIAKSIADIQPLPPGTQPVPLATIVVQVGSSTGSVSLTGANITETAVILTPQINDPSNVITAILTIVS